jgi:hypothetical protein
MPTQPGDNEICRMDAITLAQRIKSKELSALEATEAVLRPRLRAALRRQSTPNLRKASRSERLPGCRSASRTWSRRRTSRP